MYYNLFALPVIFWMSVTLVIFVILSIMVFVLFSAKIEGRRIQMAAILTASLSILCLWSMLLWCRDGGCTYGTRTLASIPNSLIYVAHRSGYLTDFVREEFDYRNRRGLFGLQGVYQDRDSFWNNQPIPLQVIQVNEFVLIDFDRFAHACMSNVQYVGGAVLSVRVDNRPLHSLSFVSMKRTGSGQFLVIRRPEDGWGQRAFSVSVVFLAARPGNPFEFAVRDINMEVIDLCEMR